MSLPLPIQDPVYVLKKGHRIGPLSVDEILDFLEEGTLDYNDLCLREGSAECERLREILDWDAIPGSIVTVPPEVTTTALAPRSGNFIEPHHTSKEPANEKVSESDRESDDAPTPPADLAPSTILYRGHPSVVKFPGSVFGILSGIGLGIWLHDVSIWITAGGFFLALLCLSYLSYCRAVRLYLISPKRVEIITGLIAKNSKEARIIDVRAINVSRSGFAGLFGVGTGEFSTAGEESEVTFSDVWSAHEVKALVREIQDNSH